MPLHMAIDYHPKEEVLVKLLECSPDAVRAYDVDMRLPLHLILEHTPFFGYFSKVVAKMMDLFPESTKKTSADGRLALHIALDRSLPKELIFEIFTQNRSAAGVAKHDGAYPLHVALMH